MRVLDHFGTSVIGSINLLCSTPDWLCVVWQVSQLEAGMLILTLLIALGFGTYCLGILDTPTRFATPKVHDH